VSEEIGAEATRQVAAFASLFATGNLTILDLCAHGNHAAAKDVITALLDCLGSCGTTLRGATLVIMKAKEACKNALSVSKKSKTLSRLQVSLTQSEALFLQSLSDARSGTSRLQGATACPLPQRWTLHVTLTRLAGLSRALGFPLARGCWRMLPRAGESASQNGGETGGAAAPT